jgi:hypothetical protein
MLTIHHLNRPTVHISVNHETDAADRARAAISIQRAWRSSRRPTSERTVVAPSMPVAHPAVSYS